MAIKVAGSSLQTDAAVIANFLQNGRKFCITTPLVFIEWEYTFSFSWEEWTGKMNMSQIFFAKCQKDFRILVLTCHMIIIQQNIGISQIATFLKFNAFSKCINKVALKGMDWLDQDAHPEARDIVVKLPMQAVELLERAIFIKAQRIGLGKGATEYHIFCAQSLRQRESFTIV